MSCKNLMMRMLALSLIVGLSMGAMAESADVPDQPLNFFFNQTLPDQDTVILSSNTPGILAGEIVQDEVRFGIDGQLRTFPVDEIAFIRHSEEGAEGEVTLQLRNGETISAEWGKNLTEQTQWLSFRMPTPSGQEVEAMAEQIRLFIPAGQFPNIPMEARFALEETIVHTYQDFRIVTDVFVLSNGVVVAGKLKADHLKFRTSQGEISVKTPKIEHVYRTGEDRFAVKLKNGALIEGTPQRDELPVSLVPGKETLDLPFAELGQFLMNDRGLPPGTGGAKPIEITPQPGEGITEDSTPQPK